MSHGRLVAYLDISNNGNGDSEDVIDDFNVIHDFNDLTENDLFDNDDYTTNLVNQNKNMRYLCTNTTGDKYIMMIPFNEYLLHSLIIGIIPPGF